MPWARFGVTDKADTLLAALLNPTRPLLACSDASWHDRRAVLPFAASYTAVGPSILSHPTSCSSAMTSCFEYAIAYRSHWLEGRQLELVF
jgi:hypothetical protein